MIEVTIFLPPKGGTFEDYATQRATDLFGGCSWLPNEVTGTCLNPDTGETVREPMERLLIAVDGFGGLALAVAFARDVGRYYCEQSVYVRALGLSEIVQIGNA